MSRRERKLLRRQGKLYKPEKHTEEAKHAETPASEKKRSKSLLTKFYDHHYKKAMWITVVLLVASLIVIGVNIAMTGEFIPRGVSLKGGVTITVPTDQPADTNEIQSYLRSQFPQASISVRALTSTGANIGFIVDASDVDPEQLLSAIKSHTKVTDKFSMETMGSALGTAFFKQTLFAIVIAFVLMSIVVFLSFRSFVPSFAVILSAFSDIVMTVAAINILGIKIETAGIAALLMLIGYSVDTDILLTTRVLKREEGTVLDRIVGAFKTGITMTGTSIAAVIVALIFTHSETLRQIMLILLIGLIFDILNTWIQNAGILMIYMERRAKKHAAATLADYEKEDEYEEVVDLEEEPEKEKNPEKAEHKPSQHAPHHNPQHTEHHAQHTEQHHTHEQHYEKKPE